MSDQFITDIGTAFVYGFGAASGGLAFVLIVALLTGVILWWMGRWWKSSTYSWLLSSLRLSCFWYSARWWFGGWSELYIAGRPMWDGWALGLPGGPKCLQVQRSAFASAAVGRIWLRLQGARSWRVSGLCYYHDLQPRPHSVERSDTTRPQQRRLCKWVQLSVGAFPNPNGAPPPAAWVATIYSTPGLPRGHAVPAWSMKAAKKDPQLLVFQCGPTSGG